MIELAPSLRPVEPAVSGTEDDEFAVPTILPFTVHGGGGPLSTEGGRELHRALMHDLREAAAASAADRAVAACRCLIGQPVALQSQGGAPIAALRLCVGARHVIDGVLTELGVERELASASVKARE